MAGKFWSLTLVGLASLLMAAAPGPAHADPQQYVVTYVEFQPAFKEVGGELLEQLATLGLKSRGAIRFSVNPEIGRPNFYVLVEIWDDANSRQKFESRDKTQTLLDAIQPLLEAPFDERPGTLIEAGKASPNSPQPGEIEVVTHIDIIPTFLDQAMPFILQYVQDSASDPGVKEFLLVSWLDITNHFQLIERFQGKGAFNAHVSAAHTVTFRNSIQDPMQPFIGSPYDERLYRTD
jgi:quinol monooxygenase YgiN